MRALMAIAHKLLIADLQGPGKSRPSALKSRSESAFRREQERRLCCRLGMTPHLLCLAAGRPDRRIAITRPPKRIAQWTGNTVEIVRVGAPGSTGSWHDLVYAHSTGGIDDRAS